MPLARHLALTRPDIGDVVVPIAAGRVVVDGRIVTNPAALVRQDARITVQRGRRLRGTAKLTAALTGFAVAVNGRVALDLGASAGGFTTALLRAGAKRVYAVDAGVGQLAGWLRQEPRVVNLEGVNLGRLEATQIPEPVELVTIDLSYLSLAEAVPQLERLKFHPAADLVALVKPMFELGRAQPPAPNDDATVEQAVKAAIVGIETGPWQIVGHLRSPVSGRRGAAERLLHGTRKRT
ncbi:MAG TPA: SAM-dependent methyltransferase [Acidimicrobiales bacterium]|nr:SAM-dependent methyltransferase [Acidimicrobiales bacterium]